jgi:peptidoglycan/LPS O-acetylase OafA/YrhL
VGIAYTFNAVVITLLLWAAVRRDDSSFGRFLNNPLVAAIGVRSYSLYLWQQIFLNHHRDSFVYRFPQNLVFAGIAAWLSYRLFASPFLALKDKIGAAHHGPTNDPAASTAQPPAQ